MAKERLQEDNIKYVVSAETEEAQQAIHKLTVTNKELAKEERARRKEMIELEAQGKKNTKEYRNIQASIKRLSDEQKTNSKLIDEHTKKLDTNGMSMVQLRKRAKELQAQLDNTSKALNPQAWSETERELTKVKNRMSELRTNGNAVGGEFGRMDSMLGKVKAAAIAFITVKLGEYLKNIVMKAYEVRKEFSQYEAVLKNTLGTQEAVADSMKRLQKLATDTPYSLKEWTEGYIKLINRGIKPTNEELINMGDIAASQGKTLEQFIEALLDAMTGENERLKEFGIRANAQGDKVKYTFKGVTTEVEKTDTAIVNYILSLGKLQGVQDSMAVQMNELAGMQSNIGDSVDNLFNKIGKRLEPFFKKVLGTTAVFIEDLSKAIEPLSDNFDEQLDRVVELELKLPKMATRYEELSGKVKRNSKEQKELNSIIEQISNIVPSAITDWDKYGRAISLNTQKVYDFMKAEKARLNFINRESIQSLRDKKASITLELESLKVQTKRKKVWAGGTGYGSTKDEGMREMTDKELGDANVRIGNLKNELLGINAQLDKISGDGIDKIVNERIATEMYAGTARTNLLKLNQKQLKAWIDDEKNASNRYMKIAQEIYESREKANGAGAGKDKSDPYAVALKKLESSNEAQINEIRLAGREKQQSDYEINNQVLAQEEGYYKKRISMLEKFSELAKKSDKRAEYEKQVVAAKTKLIDIEVEKEKAAISELQRLRDVDLANEQETSKAIQVDLANRLSEKNISQEEYNALLLSLDTSGAETRLAIQQRYSNDVAALEIKNAKLKEETVKAANKNVSDAEQASATARVKSMQYMNDMLKSFKEEFKLTTVDEDLKAQMLVLEARYQARKRLAEKENLETKELDAAYSKAKVQLVQDSENRINQVRNQYGLLNQKEQYDLQLQQLKEYLADGTLEEEEYLRAVENLKLESYKKQFDYYSGLFSGAVQALQQAEMDNVDAQYDGEIEAAKGNAEEVERLEKEKAQKKLDIQKKYADINFAIKASQIIADTAVSIMKALGELGPIAGPITAALMGITGAAQLASANAERNKVKNMTLSGSASTSKGTGQRVASGREKGGKIDVRRAQDGKLFKNAEYAPDARGFIDRPTVIVGEGQVGKSKEWVASNAAVENPTIAPILDMIDRSQRAGTIRTLDLNQVIRSKMAGYYSGGSISQPITPNNTSNNDGGSAGLPPELMEELAHAIINLNENGAKAPIVLSEFEKKQALRDLSRSIGSK